MAHPGDFHGSGLSAARRHRRGGCSGGVPSLWWRDTTFRRALPRSGPTSGWADLSIHVPGLLRLEANHAFDVADRALAGDALADAAVAEHRVHADDAAGAADHARQVLVVEAAQCLLRKHELLGLLV